MRSRRLYLATRSERASEPVLIWPERVATARSAMKVSSVSPERCEMIVVQPFRCAISTDSSVSVSVPIWFTLTSTLLAGALLDAVANALDVGDEQIVADQLHAVAQRLGQRRPSRPSRSRPCRPRSTRSGTARTAWRRTRPCPCRPAPCPRLRGCRSSSCVPQLARRDVERERDVLAGLVAGLLDRLDDHGQRRLGARQIGREAALVADAGRRLAIVQQLLQRVEHLGAGAQRLGERRRPLGTIMNSWKSSELSACAPPLMMFISGTGSTRAFGAAEVLVQRQRRPRSAAARATAIDTPSIALAPTLPLFGVPSTASIAASSPA